MSRRAKIVCTLGPATSTQERINALITAGLDVARLNLSHGSHADHQHSYQLVRAGSDAIGRSATATKSRSSMRSAARPLAIAGAGRGIVAPSVMAS